MNKKVDAEPYRFPAQGSCTSDNTAFLIIDMQRDFCEPGGYIGQQGYDLKAAREVITPIQRVLHAARSHGFMIVFTREGHRRDLSDLPKTKRLRSQNAGAEIGSPGPMGRLLVRGEPGWEIIPELAPLPGETVIDKPGYGSFYGTDLDIVLRNRGITNLVICGVTTAVCVHSTLREASDRGFDTLVLEDCCAENDPELHRAAINIVKLEGGIFGTVSTSKALLAVLSDEGN